FIGLIAEKPSLGVKFSMNFFSQGVLIKGFVAVFIVSHPRFVFFAGIMIHLFKMNHLIIFIIFPPFFIIAVILKMGKVVILIVYLGRDIARVIIITNLIIVLIIRPEFFQAMRMLMIHLVSILIMF